MMHLHHRGTATEKRQWKQWCRREKENGDNLILVFVKKLVYAKDIYLNIWLLVNEVILLRAV